MSQITSNSVTYEPNKLENIINTRIYALSSFA